MDVDVVSDPATLEDAGTLLNQNLDQAAPGGPGTFRKGKSCEAMKPYQKTRLTEMESTNKSSIEIILERVKYSLLRILIQYSEYYVYSSNRLQEQHVLTF